MGELLAGTPAIRLITAVSLPLDLVSVLALLYRAVPGSSLDPWLIAARRRLSPELAADLDLLHGFSGRLLYYVEEPVLRFEPLRADRLDADIDDLLAFLDRLPAGAYRQMAEASLARVGQDIGQPIALTADDPASWSRALEPALTTASADDVVPLLREPERLKRRTIGLFRGVWEEIYREEHAARVPALREAARVAASATDRGFGMAFGDVTGSRPPGPLLNRLWEVDRVAFCPSPHLGTFISYVLSPPDLVVFFDAPGLLARHADSPSTGATVALDDLGREGDVLASIPFGDNGQDSGPDVDADGLLEGLRALADPTRLRVLDLLAEGELYAQEIVGRLGIAQSAVSRHLSMLERAGIVAVQPRRGMKYYGLVPTRLEAIGGALRAKGGAKEPLGVP